MGRIVRIAAASLAVLVVGSAVAFFTVVPGLVDRSMNRVRRPPPYEVPPGAAELHASIPVVADLHGDALLWARDPLERHERGHIDLPRLGEANVGLQVFSAVTRVPFGLNYERNRGDSDQLVLLSAAQRWPLRTWTSPYQRAIHQAGRVERLAERAAEIWTRADRPGEGLGGLPPRLLPVRSRADLDSLVARRRRGEPVLGGVLALEGMHALEAELANLDRLHDAGFRMMGLAHFFDNAVAGSAHGVEKGGLTGLGRTALARMEELGIAVDVAHASPAAVADVLERATRPVVVSHGGVRATCPGPRNLSDDQVRGIAATGGVIGIGLWPGAVCDTTLAGTARAVRHVADLVGVEHAALGSDFDGAVVAPVDVTGLPLLTAALLEEGFDDEEVRAIMGGNVVRVLRETLPGPSGSSSPPSAAEPP